MSGDCLLAPQHAIHLISCTSPVRRTTHPCLAYDLVTDSGWPWQHLATVASRSGWYAHEEGQNRDKKSTRLNSSHSQISYAVFCLLKNIPDTLPDAPR